MNKLQTNTLNTENCEWQGKRLEQVNISNQVYIPSIALIVVFSLALL
jgi:hypothetical protein